MKFKNLRLGMKLGIGFGMLIFISVILGGLAVLNMSKISTKSGYLANEFVPEVAISNELERSALETMHEMRGYAYSEEDQFLTSANSYLDNVKEQLTKAHSLADKSTQLVKLNGSLGSFDNAVKSYEALVDKTSEENKNLARYRSAMDQAADNFAKNCYDYLQAQNDVFISEIKNSNSDNREMVNRLNKVTWINDIIDKGNALRISNYKSQATRDPQLFKNALQQFEISEELKNSRSVTHDKDNLDHLDKIEKAAENYQKAMTNFLTSWENREQINTNRNKVGEEVLASSRLVAQAGIDNTESIAGQAVQLLQTSSTVMITGLIFAILLGLAFAAIITRSITIPVSKGVKFAKEIANGNLGVTIDVNQQDEIGELAAAMQNMSDKINDIVTNIRMGADNIALASQQMSSSSQQISQGATEQASSVEEVSSSMEEMSSNIQQNTDNAKETEQIALKATQGINQGNESTTIAVKAMKDIAEKITIINDIAFQTNILALNAAVEAARAGEHGKGFAVVAAEVRKLAERSKIAADEIVDLSRNGVAISEKAGNQLAEMVPEIEKTARLVQEITAASMEQNSGSDQINNAIQQLNQVTQQNAAASEEMATSSEELASQADQLKDIIAYFNISGHG
ncbi:MAG TPA: methyl-accepting chemotaxis protein [Bacteroidales bacterium]|nr:methyl-accepting chemotaxis protein [Bacteroidales bacterium]